MVEKIDGKTHVYGLIGNPVSHSLSPLIHNSLCDITGKNSVYVTFPVEGSLKDAIYGAYALSIKGLNITVPYKKDVMDFLSKIDENAEQIGAVNTLKYTDNGYEGYNSDIYGVCATLKKYLISFDNQSLLIIGSGGGAYSAAFGAVKHGAKEIFICNRTNKNAELLASRIKKYYNVTVNIIAEGDIQNIDTNYFVIQATSVGMNISDSPLENNCVIKGASGVYDIIYSPPMTSLLSYAKKAGIPAINGIYMLASQAVKSFEIWNGQSIDSNYTDKLAQSVLQYFIIWPYNH